jgi:hypothetical protein
LPIISNNHEALSANRAIVYSVSTARALEKFNRMRTMQAVNLGWMPQSL